MARGTKLNYSARNTASGELLTLGGAELIGTLQVRFGVDGTEDVSLLRSDGTVATLHFFQLWFGLGATLTSTSTKAASRECIIGRGSLSPRRSHRRTWSTWYTARSTSRRPSRPGASTTIRCPSIGPMVTQYKPIRREYPITLRDGTVLHDLAEHWLHLFKLEAILDRGPWRETVLPWGWQLMTEAESRSFVTHRKPPCTKQDVIARCQTPQKHPPGLIVDEELEEPAVRISQARTPARCSSPPGGAGREVQA